MRLISQLEAIESSPVIDWRKRQPGLFIAAVKVALECGDEFQLTAGAAFWLTGLLATPTQKCQTRQKENPVLC